jgi:DNA-binding GntR family transcriptional regulator
MPTHSTNLADRIAAQLQDGITSGDIALGATLSEDALAEAFGVSRTPVRHALGKLQIQGLVDIRPKTATRVFEPTLEQIAELCELRSTIEQRAARLAFENRRVEAADTLESVVREMDKSIQRSDMKSYAYWDERLHEVFFTYCSNRYFQRVNDLNLAQVSALRGHLASNTPGEPARSMADHVAIAREFADGSGATLEEIIRDHVHRTKENYIYALQDRLTRKDESRVDSLRRALNITHSHHTMEEA